MNYRLKKPTTKSLSTTLIVNFIIGSILLLASPIALDRGSSFYMELAQMGACSTIITGILALILLCPKRLPFIQYD